MFEGLKNKARENEVIKGYLDNERVELGRQVFVIRNNKRITQAELAMLAGVSQHEVCRMEAGDPEIDDKVCNKIKQCLDITF